MKTACAINIRRLKFVRTALNLGIGSIAVTKPCSHTPCAGSFVLAAITGKIESNDPWRCLEADFPATLDVYRGLSNRRAMFRTLSTGPAKSISLTTPAANRCCLCARERKTGESPLLPTVCLLQSALHSGYIGS